MFSDLPPTTVSFDKNTGIKTVTEYKINEENKKVRIVKTYKIVTRKVSKSVAERKVCKSQLALSKLAHACLHYMGLQSSSLSLLVFINYEFKACLIVRL